MAWRYFKIGNVVCTVPSSMFDCNGLPREACKSNLADAIWACGSGCTHEIDGEGFQYVLDLYFSEFLGHMMIRLDQ